MQQRRSLASGGGGSSSFYNHGSSGGYRDGGGTGGTQSPYHHRLPASLMRWMTLSNQEDNPYALVPVEEGDPSGGEQGAQQLQSSNQSMGLAPLPPPGGGGGGASAVRATPPPFWPLSNRAIKMLNRIAFGVHFVMCIVSIVARYTGTAQIYKLKYDRVHLVGRPKNLSPSPSFAAAPLLQMVSPYHANATTRSTFNRTSPEYNRTISETCGAATPNTLDFAGSQAFSMDMWSYPKDSGIEIDLGWCVAAFFLLSFFFQSSLELLGATPMFRSLGYNDMFSESHSSDGQDHQEMKAAREADNVRDYYACLARELHFNWWRFIEYTGSGSLVLITIAFLAGIVDAELILCMFALAATCMLLGIVAEFSLRAGNALHKTLEFVLRQPQQQQQGSFDGSKVNPLVQFMPVLENIQAKLKLCFWLSHLLGWFCIAVPWVIVVMHYMSWWSICDSDNLSISESMINTFLGRNATATADDTAAVRRRTPPDFVMVIVFAELILYALFGMVQLFQGFFPEGNRKIEVSYILLSMFAKFFLGTMLLANVMFT